MPKSQSPQERHLGSSAKQIAVKRSVVFINDGKGRTWSIRRSNCRENHNRQLLVISGGFCGIKRFTASDPNDDISACIACKLPVAIDFFLCAFVIEFFKTA